MEDFVNRLKRTLIESVRKSTGSMTHAAKRLQCDRTALQKLIARLIANSNAREEGASTSLYKHCLAPSTKPPQDLHKSLLKTFAKVIRPAPPAPQHPV